MTDETVSRVAGSGIEFSGLDHHICEATLVLGNDSMSKEINCKEIMHRYIYYCENVAVVIEVH
jgi:hypothetical protein